jgi:hypothetical protein
LYTTGKKIPDQSETIVSLGKSSFDICTHHLFFSLGFSWCFCWSPVPLVLIFLFANLIANPPKNELTCSWRSFQHSGPGASMPKKVTTGNGKHPITDSFNQHYAAVKGKMYLGRERQPP